MFKTMVLAIVLVFSGCATLTSSNPYTLVIQDEPVTRCGERIILRDGYNKEGTSGDLLEKIILKTDNGISLVTLYFIEEELISAILHIAGDKQVSGKVAKELFPSVCALVPKEL